MLTISQIAAIISLLVAFNVNSQVIEQVRLEITPPSASTSPLTIAPVIQTPIVENLPVYFGSTAPTAVSNPQVQEAAPVVALPVVDPLTISNVEVSPGGYLRIFTNKSLANTEVSSGSLADPLIDNYLQPDGTPYPGHVYEYKLTGAQRPFTATITDNDGYSVTRTLQ